MCPVLEGVENLLKRRSVPYLVLCGWWLLAGGWWHRQAKEARGAARGEVGTYINIPRE